MRTLLFLSRVAFICNIFFLLAVSLQISRWIRNEDLEATIAMIGYFMVVLFNPLVNLLYLVFFIFRRKLLAVVPQWLVTANILFLVMQIFYVIYLNESKYP